MAEINIKKGLKKYKEAKKIILGGNMLLSKRPEMFFCQIDGLHILNDQKVSWSKI